MMKNKWLIAAIIIIPIIAIVVSWQSGYHTTKPTNSVIPAWKLNGEGYAFKPVNTQVWVMHGPLEMPNKQNKGFMNNPAFVETENAMVIIDPGATNYVGEQVLRQSKIISDKPIVASFNTHIHGDHWLANQAIAKAYPQLKTYGHSQMIAQIKEGQGKVWLATIESMTEGESKGTQIHSPKFALKHLDEIEIDGEKFRIHAPFKFAHTNTDIMIEHIKSSTLFMGDNGLNERLAPFRGNASILDAIKVLEYVLRLDIGTFVPGHGPSGNANYALKPYLHYLKTLYEVVKDGYENDLADYEIKPIATEKLKNYQDWFGFDDFIGRHTNKMLLEIEERDL